MIHCPKCNESIGENKSICPMCHHVFTEQELADIKNEIDNQDVKYMSEQRAKIEMFARKRRFLGGILLLIIFGIPILSLFFLGNKTVLILLLIAFVGGEIGVIIAGIVSGAFRCPHCNSILFRNYGTHCHSCGKLIG